MATWAEDICKAIEYLRGKEGWGLRRNEDMINLQEESKRIETELKTFGAIEGKEGCIQYMSAGTGIFVKKINFIGGNRRNCMSNNNGEIVFTKYGPYTVVDTEVVKENGEKIETPRVVSLCRCGESKNKPLCDGSHGEIGFVGDRESEDIEGTRDYAGKRITVHDNRHICSHHGTCNMDGVFLSKVDPWIVPDGTDDVEAIIEIVKKCPSGALSYTLDGKHEDSWTVKQRIVVAKDGPLHVEGNVELKDDLGSDKNLVSENHYTLCRCGKSKNKPFCDGSHIDAEFKG